MVPTVHAIYAIRNTVNGNLYIGSAVNCRRRWYKHRSNLRQGSHHSEHMQRAYEKYGAQAFEFSIIEYVDSRDRLLEREQTWIDFFKPVYNVARHVQSPMLGRRHSAETRAKMAAAKTGKKRPPRSSEWMANIAAGKLGKPLSEQARLSMAAKRMARLADPAYRKQWADARVASLRSPENLAKQALAMRGNTNTKGFKYPPEAYASRRGPRRVP